jgi:hypothetical protein
MHVLFPQFCSDGENPFSTSLVHFYDIVRWLVMASQHYKYAQINIKRSTKVIKVSTPKYNSCKYDSF